MILDLAAVHRILSDLPLQIMFQAAILTASEEGHTIRELSEQLGVPKSTLHRWISRARDRRNSGKGPRIDLVYPPDGAQQCQHESLFKDNRKRICLRCLLSNFERSGSLARHRNFDPVRVKSIRKQGPLKGGKD